MEHRKQVAQNNNRAVTHKRTLLIYSHHLCCDSLTFFAFLRRNLVNDYVAFIFVMQKRLETTARHGMLSI